MEKKLLVLFSIIISVTSFSQFYQFDTTTICANDTIVLGGVSQNSPGTYYDSILCPNTRVLLYSEDFDGALTWTLNTSTGTNGVTANSWYINDDEGGVLPSNCSANGNGNNTLHIADLKTGGVLIKSEGNSQLMIYAYGALLELEMFYDIHNIELHIISSFGFCGFAVYKALKFTIFS